MIGVAVFMDLFCFMNGKYGFEFFPLPCYCWTLGMTFFRPLEMPCCKDSKHRKVLLMEFSGTLQEKKRLMGVVCKWQGIRSSGQGFFGALLQAFIRKSIWKRGS